MLLGSVVVSGATPDTELGGNPPLTLQGTRGDKMGTFLSSYEGDIPTEFRQAETMALTWAE